MPTDDEGPPPPPPGDPAEVKVKDVDSAVKFWERFSPPEFRGLITAKPGDEGS